MADARSAWKPNTLKDFHTALTRGGAHAQDAAADLDKSMQRIYQIQMSQQSTINGTKSGTLIVTNGQATNIDTGLAQVNDVIVGVRGLGNTGADLNPQADVNPQNPGGIDIVIYKITAGVPAIFTPSTITVSWIAVGVGQ